VDILPLFVHRASALIRQSPEYEIIDPPLHRVLPGRERAAAASFPRTASELTKKRGRWPEPRPRDYGKFGCRRPKSQTRQTEITAPRTLGSDSGACRSRRGWARRRSPHRRPAFGAASQRTVVQASVDFAGPRWSVILTPGRSEHCDHGFKICFPASSSATTLVVPKGPAEHDECVGGRPRSRRDHRVCRQPLSWRVPQIVTTTASSI